MSIQFIKKGGIDTSDATATASDILKDKTAYVNGEKLTGILEMGEYNAKVNTTFTNQSSTLLSKIIELPTMDLNGTASASYKFANCTSLLKIENIINTENLTNTSGMFSSCLALTTIPLFNTSNVTNMSTMFQYNTHLTTIPLFNTNKVTNMSNMFTSCIVLSENSLNNILAMCIEATSYTETKTLAQIGLSQEQATTCQGLSNYQAFLNAGWTTGY